MNYSDRYVVSRADGFNPGLVFSLTTDQRENAQKKGTYQAELFESLFGRVLPQDATMSTWLPPVEKENKSQVLASVNTMALEKLRKNIPDTPKVTLDMPGVANDYYTHSLALCGKNAAVILGNICYVVSDIALGSRVIKQVHTRNTFGLACVEWLNPTTLAIGYQRSSELYLVDTCLQKAPQRQVGLQRICLGQLTRITRLSDSVFLTGYKNGEVVFNDAITGESHSLLGMNRSPDSICSIAPSKYARHIAVGYDNGFVNVYQLTSQKTFALVRSYNSHVFAGKRALAWLPGSESRFICGGGIKDPVLRVFDILSAENVATYPLPFSITNIVFTADRQFVATYANRIGYFVLADNAITLLKEVVTASTERLLDAVYNPQAGLITTSAGEFLNIWPPIPHKPSQNQSGGIKPEVIR